MQIILNIFPRIRLHCKLVPLQYWEYEYGLFFINHVPLHVLPLPVYPGLQAQRYEPIVLEHCAFKWQVEGKEVHSLTSAGKRNNVSIKWSMRCLPDLPLSLGFEWKIKNKDLWNRNEWQSDFNVQFFVYISYFVVVLCNMPQQTAFWRETEGRLQKKK